tara:strand:- start:197 stop:454 length:258 start_codon:yes stop_codon:yes gene_type:complete
MSKSRKRSTHAMKKSRKRREIAISPGRTISNWSRMVKNDHTAVRVTRNERQYAGVIGTLLGEHQSHDGLMAHAGLNDETSHHAPR